MDPQTTQSTTEAAATVPLSYLVQGLIGGLLVIVGYFLNRILKKVDKFEELESRIQILEQRLARHDECARDKPEREMRYQKLSFRVDALHKDIEYLRSKTSRHGRVIEKLQSKFRGFVTWLSVRLPTMEDQSKIMQFTELETRSTDSEEDS